MDNESLNGSAESNQRQRRDQKDSNDVLAMTKTDELQLTAFDCSDYNIGRNQFPKEDGEEEEQQEEPDFADSNEDLLDHGGDDSNDLAIYDFATLCLIDADAEDGPDLYLCHDISEAKGLIIPYEYRVYVSKNVDDSIKEQDGSPVAVASKVGSSTGSSTTSVTSRIDTVRGVESRIIAHIASTMGLAGCDVSTSASPPDPALRRRSLSSTNAIESTRHRRLAEGDNAGSRTPLIGISSDPIDGIAGELFCNNRYRFDSIRSQYFVLLFCFLRTLTHHRFLVLPNAALPKQTVPKIPHPCHFIACTSRGIWRRTSMPLQMMPP